MLVKEIPQSDEKKKKNLAIECQNTGFWMSFIIFCACSLASRFPLMISFLSSGRFSSWVTMISSDCCISRRRRYARKYAVQRLGVKTIWRTVTAALFRNDWVSRSSARTNVSPCSHEISSEASRDIRTKAVVSQAR